MTSVPPVAGARPVRRRDLQKQETRLALALAAFDLATEHGVPNVRVPQIAAAAGVSPRTFSNYFPGKEAAIVWPATLRAGRLAASLANRPAAESLADAIAATVAGKDAAGETDGLPSGWLDQFRALVAVEPALHGECLKAAAAAETALAAAIARRAGIPASRLEPMLLAAVAIAAERAAVLHWPHILEPRPPLAAAVRAAVAIAVHGITGTGIPFA